MLDYKNQLSDILSADTQLAKEIEYDLAKFEKNEEARSEFNLKGFIKITVTSFLHIEI